MATALAPAAAGYPTDVSIITTYRCQMRCKMCDIWENPSDSKKEIQAKELEMLPNFKFVNITGGEPFVEHYKPMPVTTWCGSMESTTSARSSFR